MNIKNAVLKVFSANVIQLISNLIIGFLVPKIMTIDGYANLKTYTLYISYIGFLHLGFPDGLFIKYGGMKYYNIDKGILKGEHNFLVIFQFIISIVFFIIALYLKNILIFLVSISILPIMIQCFHKNIAQATGEFDKYSKIMYIYNITYLFLNILLAIIFKNTNYIFYCLTTFGANLISVFIFEIKFLKENIKYKAVYNKKNIINSIKVGFLIMLGNLIVVGLFGLDKIFVKIFLSTEEFAYYSFAVSMLNIINVLISAISITFYNYLCLNNYKESINKLKKYFLIIGGFASSAYFILEFIINNFLIKYTNSLNITAITFSVFPYMIVINSLYLNLYKVDKNEKKYIKIVLLIFSISIIYNFIAICLFKNTESIAFATLFTLITWIVISTYDLKNVDFEISDFLYTIILTISFIFSTMYIKGYKGLIIYMLTFISFTIIFYKKILIKLKEEFLSVFKRKWKNEENRINR